MQTDIIQIDKSPPPTRDRFVRYEPQFERFFGGIDDSLSFRYHYILDGDDFPDPASLDAVMITGSAIGVYDHTDWIDPLREFIRTALEAGKPMLGVCFGHQIIADALGGDVRKSEKGWGLGRQDYRVLDRSGDFANLPDDISLPASHQDQVITPPAGARTWLGSDFCPHAGLIYDTGRVVSLQPHPEWDRAYAGALVELRRRDPLSDADVAAALAALNQPMDEECVGRALLGCLRQSPSNT